MKARLNFMSYYNDCLLCISQRMALFLGKRQSITVCIYSSGIPYFPMEMNLPKEMHKSGYHMAMVRRTMHTYPMNHSYGFQFSI